MLIDLISISYFRIEGEDARFVLIKSQPYTHTQIKKNYNTKEMNQ